MIVAKIIPDSLMPRFKYKFFYILQATLILSCMAPYLAWGEVTLCEQEKIREAALNNTADLYMLLTIDSLVEPSSKNNKVHKYLDALFRGKTEDSKIILVQLELLNIKTNQDLDEMYLVFDDSKSGILLQELLAKDDDYEIDDKISKSMTPDLKGAFGNEGLALFEALFKALKRADNR